MEGEEESEKASEEEVDVVVTIEVCGVDDCSRQRPYHVESTGSRPITEVKLRRAGLVLAWVTGWEYPVLLTSFHLLFPHSSHQYTHARTRPFAHAPTHTHTHSLELTRAHFITIACLIPSRVSGVNVLVSVVVVVGGGSGGGGIGGDSDVGGVSFIF